MRKRYLLFHILLFSCIMLFGCSKEEIIAEPEPTAQLIEEIMPDLQEIENVTENPDAPPFEGMVKSRITNEWIDETVANTRPIAIMIPNSKTASHYGISEASVLYEFNTEGSMTWLMAIIEDWNNLDRVGNVRDGRDYCVYWAFEWDAFYFHWGAPIRVIDYIDEVISREDTQNINCLTYVEAAYRKSDAKNTYDNLFTDTEYIKKALEHYDYPTAYREGYADETHYQFAAHAAPNTLEQYSDSITAKTVDMSSAYPITNCYFEYNESTGLYERYQHLAGDDDGPHIDLANGKQLSFKNILIQNTYYEVRDQMGFLAFQCLDTSRDGWFFTNGRGIHVAWKKTSDYGATRYFDDDGNEINLNTGKTMVCIVEDGDAFMVDDQKISKADK